MSVTINELSITVPKNVVKNNDANGDTVLRVTQEQAQSIYDSLGPVLDFFAQATPAVPVTPVEANGSSALTEAGIQHDGDAVTKAAAARANA